MHKYKQNNDKAVPLSSKRGTPKKQLFLFIFHFILFHLLFKYKKTQLTDRNQLTEFCLILLNFKVIRISVLQDTSSLFSLTSYLNHPSPDCPLPLSPCLMSKTISCLNTNVSFFCFKISLLGNSKTIGIDKLKISFVLLVIAKI